MLKSTVCHSCFADENCCSADLNVFIPTSLAYLRPGLPCSFIGLCFQGACLVLPFPKSFEESRTVSE